MASPQLEDGYTRIANELLDAFCRTRIPGQARQVLDFIFRKTYGFNKPFDCISNSQFVAGTGLSKDKVCHLLGVLEGMNLIVVAEKGNNWAKSYAINVDYTSWQQLPKKAKLPIKATKVANKGNNCCPIGPPQKKKENLTKEKKTKDSLPSSVAQNGNEPENPTPQPPVEPDPPEEQTTDEPKKYPPEIVEFVTVFQKHVRKTLRKQAPNVTQALIGSGCEAVDRLIRLDGYTLAEIKIAMRWALRDDFWCKNSRSIAHLRVKGSNGLTKFQNIVEAMKSDRSGFNRDDQGSVARACLYSLLELRRQGKWKAVGPGASTMKVDCSSLAHDPARDLALQRCPPPNDTWKIDNVWTKDFPKAYEIAARDAAETNGNRAA